LRGQYGRRYRTALFGVGQIGAGYAYDAMRARYFEYATHAQVLAAHPSFEWVAAVDPSQDALARVSRNWNVPILATTVDDLARRCELDVAVIAFPPGPDRERILDLFPSLRAIIVEKPLGVDLAEAERFVQLARRAGVLVQVNFYRRGDSTFRTLASGELFDRIGHTQAVFGVYGNGLRNNAVHIIDLLRLLYGEVDTVQAIPGPVEWRAGPLKNDVQFPFAIRMTTGFTALMQPLDFGHYRENGLDIWGEKARLGIWLEGLLITIHPKRENRALSETSELAMDDAKILPSTIGAAFYNIYENVARAVSSGEPLWSSGDNALRTSAVVEAAVRSVNESRRPVSIEHDEAA
jgi:predicted dehydrogenase